MKLTSSHINKRVKVSARIRYGWGSILNKGTLLRDTDSKVDVDAVVVSINASYCDGNVVVNFELSKLNERFSTAGWDFFKGDGCLTSVNGSVILDQDKYYWVTSDEYVKPISLPCCECSNFYDDVTSNLADHRFVCWACRSARAWKYNELLIQP
jgi:hypothetical protein